MSEQPAAAVPSPPEDAAEHHCGPMVRFVATTIVGAVFFLLPVPVGGQWTIPFDVVVSGITKGLPQVVATYCLLALLASALLSLAAAAQARGALPQGAPDLEASRTGPVFLGLRLLGGVFAVMIYFGGGPPEVLADSAGGLMFNTLVASVAGTVLAIPLIAGITYLVF